MDSTKHVDEKLNFGEYFHKEKWKEHLGEHFLSQKISIRNKEALRKKFSFLENIESFGTLKFQDGEHVPVYIMKVANTKASSRVKLTSLAYNVIKEDVGIGSALFFILYDGDEDNYRFSYVKSVRGIKEGRCWNIKRDPKRYTYLLGRGIKTHTAETRLKKEIFTSIESIEEAFSVEAINKEFYKGIKEYFEKLSIDVLPNFDNDKKEANEFSLRFIGRLLFCRFLKEKNLVPAEALNINSIDKKNKNYYKDVLSILFFNMLNETIENRRLQNTALAKYEKDIPFLNGGLFSAKDEDRKVEKIDNGIIEEIFNFLEKYNFTVDESTPIDIEISIDPEMLGRIFENLLAEINPETEKAARKETGSFYTPREIVDYMVVESIKLYFVRKLPKLKDKIEKLFLIDEECEACEEEKKEILKAIHEMRILDPACGSGAFPMGILQRVFMLINKIDYEHKYYKELILKKLDGAAKADIEKRIANDTLDYAYKLDILQGMIHGVDIQSMAIELSRLRAFLSLIVEENKNENDKDNLGIKPLPNLEFQFIAANSLITLDLYESEDNKLGLDDDFTTSLIETIKKISKDYFHADTVEKKKEAKYNFEAFRQRLETTSTKLIENKFKEKLLSWDPFKTKTADFFNHNIQFGMEGSFDIVLGNPPYGAKQTKEEKKYYKNNYEVAKTIQGFQKGSADTFSLFIEKSLSITNLNGIMNLIVPIAITSSESMMGIHNLLEGNCELIKISNYAVRPKPIFKNAVVDVSILFCVNTKTKNKNILSTKMYRKSQSKNIKDIIDNLEFIDIKDLKLIGRYPKISYKIERNILKKIFSLKNDILSLSKTKGNKIYYRCSGGRYWKVITNYTTLSTKEKFLHFDKNIANSIGCILSTNLYFWFYQIYSNNHDLRLFEINDFKIPIEKLDEATRNKIEILYNKYLKDIEKNAIIHEKTNYANIASFKEYRIRLSKNIIDEMDDLICPLYGLTKEEIYFIKNYELEFRKDISSKD